MAVAMGAYGLEEVASVGEAFLARVAEAMAADREAAAGGAEEALLEASDSRRGAASSVTAASGDSPLISSDCPRSVLRIPGSLASDPRCEATPEALPRLAL